jgi:nucleoid-associated protein YgaU
MANRYIYTNSKEQNETKTKYFESTIYPKVAPSDNDIYIITGQGDRLDLLSNKYYGDPKLWWIIATANNLNDATLAVAPGRQLRIPSNTSIIISNLEKINK